MLRGTNPRACALMLAVLCAGPAFAQKFDQKKVSLDAATNQKMIAQLHPDYQHREAAAPAAAKVQLSELRANIVAQKFTFSVGYTAAAEKDLKQLCGTVIPANLAQIATEVNAKSLDQIRMYDVKRAEFVKLNPHFKFIIRPTCSASASKWDERAAGKVTPIRDQSACGSCWDFAAVGAWEISNRMVNGTNVDLSEQQILTCAGAGSCGGGWYMPVFNWMISHGVAPETACPYQHNDMASMKPAWTGLPSPNKAVAWGFVGPSGGIPTVAQIKQAICTHGSVAVAVYATSAFQHYVGGVFNEHDTTHGINHAVVLIGWDDTKQAWLMRNSWGTSWGDTCGYGAEKGYMWISYNSNNIGYASAWVQAKHGSY